MATITWWTLFVVFTTLLLPSDAKTSVGLMLSPLYAMLVGGCIAFMMYGTHAATMVSGWRLGYLLAVALSAAVAVFGFHVWLATEVFG